MRAAFDFYLKHHHGGRPFIIASHSQGTVHALHLLEDVITGEPLRQKRVAAYLVGMSVPKDVFTRTLPELPLCTSAEQTGCAVTWNAIGPKADPSMFNVIQQRYPAFVLESIVGKRLACTNPITWTFLAHSQATSL